MKFRIISAIVSIALLLFLISCSVSDETLNIVNNHKEVSKDYIAHLPTVMPSVLTTKTPTPTLTPVPDYWEPGLVFYDDFENNFNAGFFNTVWRNENFNNELQFYHPANVFIENGNLVLRAKKQDLLNHKYTSGLVDTFGKFHLKYGRIEISAKHPAGNGFFVAIWLSPSGEEYLPEIDIMEVLGEKPEEIWVVNHYLKRKEKYRNYTNYIIKNIEDFHTYTLIWTKNKISWYIDKELILTTKKGVPNEEMYLIINLAVGGIWPVSPDESTVFPADFEIDYIKIYKEGY